MCVCWGGGALAGASKGGRVNRCCQGALWMHGSALLQGDAEGTRRSSHSRIHSDCCAPKHTVCGYSRSTAGALPCGAGTHPASPPPVQSTWPCCCCRLLSQHPTPPPCPPPSPPHNTHHSSFSAMRRWYSSQPTTSQATPPRCSTLHTWGAQGPAATVRLPSTTLPSAAAAKVRRTADLSNA